MLRIKELEGAVKAYGLSIAVLTIFSSALDPQLFRFLWLFTAFIGSLSFIIAYQKEKHITKILSSSQFVFIYKSAKLLKFNSYCEWKPKPYFGQFIMPQSKPDDETSTANEIFEAYLTETISDLHLLVNIPQFASDFLLFRWRTIYRGNRGVTVNSLSKSYFWPLDVVLPCWNSMIVFVNQVLYCVWCRHWKQ